MTTLKTVASLFENTPPRWGLRGDPYLWREMRAHFEQTPLPASSDQLSALIEAAFESLTGHLISELDGFFIERFSHGGMSSGYVSPNFWREQVVSLLGVRFSKIDQSV
jgi:molybdenum cofactor cytidylyltransferase